MKTFFFSFILGALCGAFGLYYYQQQSVNAPYPGSSAVAPSTTASSFSERTREAAGGMTDNVSSRFREWNLTPEDIRRDLAKGGQVIRSNAIVAGEKIGDARIVAMIKAKYVLDRDLSALDINVDCADGRVTLAGKVETADLLAKAMALALDTKGVNNVVANLFVQPKE